MTDRIPYLLVGGGLTAASAARAIREADEDARIVMLTAEDHYPYHRPPLSKDFLKGRTERSQLLVQPESWYDERGVEVRTRSRVVHVDPAERRVELADGAVVEYGRCLLATGGRPRTLDLPGADLGAIHTLREIPDSEEIRSAADAGSAAVVVGASFIGMEVASALAEKGLDVTVMELAPRVWPVITDDALAGFFEGYFEDRGVKFLLGDGPQAFEGAERVESVVTREGRTVACDLVVVGVGIELNLDYLSDADVETSDGVVVDEQLRTSAEGLYAAGDIANYPDRVLGKRMRIEHWDNAKAQGTHAGTNMVGEEVPYEHMSYFFSDVFDLSLNVVGETGEYDRVLIRGDLDEASFLALYLRDRSVRGALTVGREWAEVEAAKTLVSEAVDVDDDERWSDPSVALEDLREA